MVELARLSGDIGIAVGIDPDVARGIVSDPTQVRGVHERGAGVVQLADIYLAAALGDGIHRAWRSRIAQGEGRAGDICIALSVHRDLTGGAATPTAQERRVLERAARRIKLA